MLLIYLNLKNLIEQYKSDDEDEFTVDKINNENSGSMNKLFQLFCVLQLKVFFQAFIHYYKLLLH
jgi:hypothetical protein